jgi:predicted nucleic acid-binding protein
MVGTPALFDTNILIDYFSSRPQARIELDRHSDRTISITTWMQIMVGSTATDEGALNSSR